MNLLNHLTTATLGLAILGQGCRAHTPDSVKVESPAEFATCLLPSTDVSAIGSNIIDKLHLQSYSVSRLNETIVLSPPASMMDGITYTIKIDYAKRMYWLYESGGIAGLHRTIGPFSIEPNDLEQSGLRDGLPAAHAP